MSRAGSSRWSPTPEQLMILEQLYRSGIKTPSAPQIQHITTHLCFYGRIEGKNVFYWFQNHKARDRQKLRRKLNKQLQLQQQQQQYQMLAHQCQVINHQDDKAHHHRWSFGGFDSSPGSSSAQQVPFYNPPILFSQGETPSETWKTSAQKQQQSEVMDRTKMTSSLYYNNTGMSSYRWSVADVNEESSYYCSSRPLKTLDLFPTTSSKLKQDPFKT